MKKLIIAVTIAITTGCTSTPKSIEPVAIDNNHSVAYNIAAQTDLLDDASPLRDFTQAEIEESTINLEKSAGSTSKVIGVANILMGNLTGVIDVAGGSAASLALNNHQSNKARWIVMLPKTEFNSAKEAQDYIKQEIKKASIDVMSQFGNIEKIDAKNNRSFHSLNIGERSYFVGLAERTNNDKVFVKEGVSLDIETNETFDSYVYGLDKSSLYMSGMIISPAKVTIANVEAQTAFITQDELNIEVSKRLPKGFYLYTPSIPRLKYNKKTYSDKSVLVPTVYSQGIKYEFIKP